MKPFGDGLKQPRAKTDDFAHQLYYQDSDFQVVDHVVELTESACQRLEEPYQPHPVLGHR